MDYKQYQEELKKNDLLTKKQREDFEKKTPQKQHEEYLAQFKEFAEYIQKNDLRVKKEENND